MAKITTSAVFKEYNPSQALLLPPTLDDLIEESHLSRVVNRVVDAMDISILMNQYQGGGTSSYHPRMLLKVLLYGYSMKIYTGRKIARALRSDIHFMWLASWNKPDFRTINNFRSSKAKDVINELFQQMLLFLIEHQYIKMENYFNDGSTFGADANKYKVTWKKNAERYQAATKEKCQKLFEEIDQLNAAENRQYGNLDLEERGLSASQITPEKIDGQVAKLDKIIETTVIKKTKRKAESLKKKVREKQQKIDQYQAQQECSGGRSGYSKTDPDATAMRMKNEELLPAYNVMTGSENQFITAVSVHQQPNDGACFKEHLQQAAQQWPVQPKAIIADSIFGNEQNYELLDKLRIENYLKFPSFHREQKKKFKEQIFQKENFSYNSQTDSFTCPNQQHLVYKGTFTQTHPKTGYVSHFKEYQCQECQGCPFYDQCCKSEKGRNRTIKLSEKLEKYKQQARENLTSEKGVALRKQRSIEIESCFGDIKHNMGFRRFHLRGLNKVKTEFIIVAMAHNLRKVHLKNRKAA